MKTYSMTYLTLIVLCILILFAVGCGRFKMPVIPPQGLLFTGIKAPITTNYDHTPTPEQISHISQSSTHYFRDIIFTRLDFSWGDVAVKTIADLNGFKRIYYADYEYLNILGIYAKLTIKVYGSKE